VAEDEKRSALDAFAGQVDRLRQRVDTAAAKVAAWDARLQREGIGATLVVRAELKKLDRRVCEMEAALADAVDKRKLKDPPAPYWDGLDQAGFAGQLRDLTGWVEGFLRVQYPGYPLAACWPWHPEALWELGTLYAEWQRTYADPDNRDLAGALWWHERWLPGALGRLTKSITCDEAGCQRAARARRTGQP
jgi:hypothetical protein